MDRELVSALPYLQGFSEKLVFYLQDIFYDDAFELSCLLLNTYYARLYDLFGQNTVLLATAVLNNSIIIVRGSQIVWGRYDYLNSTKGTYEVYKNLPAVDFV